MKCKKDGCRHSAAVFLLRIQKKMKSAIDRKAGETYNQIVIVIGYNSVDWQEPAPLLIDPTGEINEGNH